MLQPLSIAVRRASSNESPVIDAKTVKSSEEYAFDISFIIRSRTLSTKIADKQGTPLSSRSANASSCLAKDVPSKELYCLQIPLE